MNSILTVLLWLALSVFSAMRFAVQTKYSPLERARLARQGDAAALSEAEAIDRAPLLASLVFILRTLVLAGLIAYCVVSYGVLNGIIIGTVAMLLVPLTFRVPFFISLADKMKEAFMPWFIKAATALKPFLLWVRERDLAVADDAVLNSQDELLALVKRSPGVSSREEQERLVANLQFDDKKVADIMTPRSMVDAVPARETLGPLVLDELYKTGHSRFPVYEKDLDHIVGVLFLRDLVDMRQGSQAAKEAMHAKVYFIGKDKTLSHALHGFLKTKNHLFVVVNEYRETVGILSIEDVIEALLGAKIQDEFDAFDDLRAVAEHNPHKNNAPRTREDI